jgi:hypothetical protein
MWVTVGRNFERASAARLWSFWHLAAMAYAQGTPNVGRIGDARNYSPERTVNVVGCVASVGVGTYRSSNGPPWWQLTQLIAEIFAQFRKQGPTVTRFSHRTFRKGSGMRCRPRAHRACLR